MGRASQQKIRWMVYLAMFLFAGSSAHGYQQKNSRRIQIFSEFSQQQLVTSIRVSSPSNETYLRVSFDVSQAPSLQDVDSSRILQKLFWDFYDISNFDFRITQLPSLDLGTLRIIEVSREEMARHQDPLKVSIPFGNYVRLEKTLYLLGKGLYPFGTGITNDNRNRAILGHELFHFLQDQIWVETMDCQTWEKREQEAVQAQYEWLLANSNLDSSFFGVRFPSGGCRTEQAQKGSYTW